MADTSHLAEWRTSDRCRTHLREIGRQHGAANGRAQALPPLVAAARIRWRHYRNSAAARELEWALTFDEFIRLVLARCWYCGADPAQVYRNFKDYPHNGIDRIDNSVGYVVGNVVTACGECNSAKGTRTQEEFLSLAKRIATRHCDD